MQENNTEIGELKSLLFEEEMDTFKKLEEKIRNLSFEFNNTEQIIARISPLIDDLLKENLQKKDSRTIGIYADSLAEIINKSAEQDISALSRSLQNVISPIIGKEIDINKDKMVDILYPTMGSMISKYVSNAIQEMMDTIDKKINEGLSVDKYKRKIKSKVSGVSETELLLEENNDALMSSIFIIHKDSGLLVAEAHLEDQEINDPHMVASMASAIKDFINDWISKNDEPNEVQLLSYGNATLYIESAGTVYQIVFLESEPNHIQRKTIQSFFSKIVKNYSHFFPTFNGDDCAVEIQQMQKEMQLFLNQQDNKVEHKSKKKSNASKYILFALLALLLGYLAIQLKEKYVIYSLEQDILEQTNEVVNIDANGDMLQVSGYINSRENYSLIQNILYKESNNGLLNKMYLPLNEIEKKVLKENIALVTLSKKLSAEVDILTNDLNKLQLELDRLKEVKSTKITMDIETYVKAILSSKFGHLKSFNVDDSSLTFNDPLLFEVGKATLNLEYLKELGILSKEYIEVLLDDTNIAPYIKSINIESYTDSSGDASFNNKLSYARAKQFKEYLLTLKDDNSEYGVLGNLDTLLYVKGRGSSDVIYRNGKEDKITSRRIKVSFIYDYKKMLKKLTL
ncbi:MAG: OmpA family protein [Campylobacterota bacterium]|nr:OmpA family protein [Campylobacterota bacterium]